LRRRGVDALTAQEAGRGRLHDSDHLAFALAEERVLVTMDSDFLALSARALLTPASCSGARRASPSAIGRMASC
ncbi:MAG: DUF5615 family PIN-like protein, partial [Armatimonadetes bacterium]|nr:DUF5615 family PIN-like protein [Armatimonadota bacterium]